MSQTHKDGAGSMGFGGVRVVNNVKNSGGDAVYGLGLIGSLIYFISHAVGFWGVILGILKALVWPAFVVYELLNFFKL